MKKYLIAYMNSTSYTNQSQRISTATGDFNRLPTLTEAEDFVKPVHLRSAREVPVIIAISEIGGF